MSIKFGMPGEDKHPGDNVAKMSLETRKQPSSFSENRLLECSSVVAEENVSSVQGCSWK